MSDGKNEIHVGLDLIDAVLEAVKAVRTKRTVETEEAIGAANFLIALLLYELGLVKGQQEFMDQTRQEMHLILRAMEHIVRNAVAVSGSGVVEPPDGMLRFISNWADREQKILLGEAVHVEASLQ
jgi:hypothetical protein